MWLRTAVKELLEKRGIYVRAAAGMPLGFDLALDLDKAGIRPTCAFDVGAHHGQTSISYIRKFPGCRVFAFEPVASNFTELKKAVADNLLITPVNAAVGDRPGRHEIWLSLDNSQAHSLVTATGGDGEIVDVITIDDFCKSEGVQPDFIKFDIEGYELNAIAGAHDTLSDSRLKAVVTEATFDPQNTDHTQIAELMVALKPLGFHLVAIHDQTHWQRTQQLEYFNALFVKR